jgi:hypothetical protein
MAFKVIAPGEKADLFAWDKPVWTKAGVVAPSGSGTMGTRNSFPHAEQPSRYCTMRWTSPQRP